MNPDGGVSNLVAGSWTGAAGATGGSSGSQPRGFFLLWERIQPTAAASAKVQTTAIPAGEPAAAATAAFHTAKPTVE